MRGPKANRELSLVLTALSLTACMAPVGTSGVISVQPDAAQSCAQHCQAIGIRLTAVAIMANNVGCVCQSPAPAGSAPAGSSSRAAPGSTDPRSFGVNEGATEGATTTAGMVAILMERERQEAPPPPIRY